MEDNRRILKFNNLSRYRMERNIKTVDRNKENMIDYTN